MKKQRRFKSPGILFPLFLVVIMLACSIDNGLSPVSGVDGDVRIRGTWPDTIQAVIIGALSELNPDALQDALVAYSDPVMQGDSTLDLFIQLEPGAYSLVPVGITIDPGFLIANLDSILTAPHLPLVPLFDVNEKPPTGIRSVGIGEGSVRQLDTTWVITF